MSAMPLELYYPGVQPEPVRRPVRLVQGTASTRPTLMRTQCVSSEYVESQRAVWMYMNHLARPCFTLDLIADMRRQQDAIAERPDEVDFLVTASMTPGVFNLGGDLDLFRKLSAAGDYDGLLFYATQCVDGVFNYLVGLGTETVTIALVEGDALGGGLELALSNHIVVAQRGVKMGFPEMLFNLFPGMGAYSILARKVGPRLAEDLITSGRILTAEQMHELGLVDYLAEPGEGEAVVRKVIAGRRTNLHGYWAYQRAKQHGPLRVSRTELIEITREWVEAACSLASRDRKVMERLVRAQDKRTDVA